MLGGDDRADTIEIFHYDCLDSTQNQAKILNQSRQSPKPYVVVANKQTKGRGRYDRVWESDSTSNLYCTVVIESSQLPELSIMPLWVATILHKTVSSFSEHVDIQLKWPNDILLAGKKCAGILIERHLTDCEDTCFIGVGVNVKDYPCNGLIYPATSLHAEAIDVSVADVLDNFLANIEGSLQLDFDNEEVISYFLSNAYGINKEITVQLPNKTLKGQFKTLNAQGHLVVESNGKEHIVHAGDVFFR